jgi:protein-L-isoaspartate(D-aspartate) O-methyltransferase
MPIQRQQTLAQNLVDALKARGYLSAPHLEAAFANVPRHLFLPGVAESRAYSDVAISLDYDLSGEVLCSAPIPGMIARLLEQARLAAGQNLLEIGTGTGYTAALLHHIVGDTGRVTTLEIERQIARRAQDHLQRAVVSDVAVVNEDGAFGYAPRAAYDRIVSSVGIWDMPLAWVRQLKPQGLITAPVWLDGLQVSAAFTLQPDGSLYSEDVSPSAFVYIRGAAAGPRVRKRIGSTALTLIADDVDQIDSAALYVLLSADDEASRLSAALNSCDYWYGFLPYMMLHEDKNAIFALYDITHGSKAYGMEGEGFALFTPASACFVPYYGLGFVQNFAGADAYLQVEAYLDAWQRAGHPGIDRLRLRLIPKEHGQPQIAAGKVYTRQHHYLHVWLEPTDDDEAT